MEKAKDKSKSCRKARFARVLLKLAEPRVIHLFLRHPKLTGSVESGEMLIIMEGAE